MKLTRTTLVLPLAGLLIVAGASAVLASSGPAGTTGTTSTVAPAAASPSPSTGTATAPVEPRDTALSDALDSLVSKGTITAAQKTAILDAVTAERTARRAARQAERQQIKQFLADGQITQDELNQLPADSYLRTLTNLMADGKITTDELRALGKGFGLGRGGHMRGMGGGMWGPNGVSPNASPAPSSGTSG